MSIQRKSVARAVSATAYPGRGIIVGLSSDGRKAMLAYFIMGRSANSRNRIFVKDGDALYTQPYDASKVEDPSLIIYAPLRELTNVGPRGGVRGKEVVVTNGDQTDTVYDSLKEGRCFRHALMTRCFEPDAPNFTPRISAILHLGDCAADGKYGYELSILKSADGKGKRCNRFFYAYEPVSGTGHYVHTYMKDGNPLPSFEGEPERVKLPSDVKQFADQIWNNLNNDNKISLYCRSIELSSGKEEEVLINKYAKE